MQKWLQEDNETPKAIIFFWSQYLFSVLKQNAMFLILNWNKKIYLALVTLVLSLSLFLFLMVWLWKISLIVALKYRKFVLVLLPSTMIVIFVLCVDGLLHYAHCQWAEHNTISFFFSNPRRLPLQLSQCLPYLWTGPFIELNQKRKIVNSCENLQFSLAVDKNRLSSLNIYCLKSEARQAVCWPIRQRLFVVLS